MKTTNLLLARLFQCLAASVPYKESDNTRIYLYNLIHLVSCVIVASLCQCIDSTKILLQKRAFPVRDKNLVFLSSISNAGNYLIFVITWIVRKEGKYISYLLILAIIASYLVKHKSLQKRWLVDLIFFPDGNVVPKKESMGGHQYIYVDED